MNAAIIKRRVEKLERQSDRRHDFTFTLEELCRSLWRADKKRLLALAKKSNVIYFIPQFQFEDAEPMARRLSGRGR